MRIPFAAAPLFLLMSGGAFAADGCPPGDTSITNNGTSVSVIFDVFLATTTASATCNLVAPTLLPQDTFAVYRADYRGFVIEGDTGTLTTTQGGVSDVAVIPGSATDFFHTGYVGSNAAGNIVSDISLNLQSPNPPSQAGLDSVDYVELGRTTLASVESSIGDIATGRTGIVTHLNATSELLVGGGQPVERPDNVALLGAVGSHTVGATGHLNMGDGFTVDGGVALFGQSVGESSADGLLFSGRAKYLQPDTGGIRLFGGAGINAAPGMSLGSTRQYDDGSADGATVKSSTSGSLVGLYLEGGALYAPDPSNEIAFTGTLLQSWLSVDGYSETFGTDNLFPATFGDSTNSFTTVKADAAWTSAVTPDIDLTVHGAIGHTFANDAVTADVAFVGPVSVGGQSELFAEYGARLGWTFGPSTTLGVFAQGSSGAVSGTHVQAGTTLSMQF
ncbi:hypothetical protein [Devosia sp.]|uniref:hypothetical protein n=1 Tax=Devosia sp. TaxID=1871048 RepID=UPI003F71D8E5